MAILDEINKISRWLHKNFWALNFWVRSVISALIGACAGAVVLAFLNRIAFYGYAINENLRVPLKGMPYLDLVALLLGFCLLMALLLSGFVIYSILLLVSRWFAKLFRVRSEIGRKGIDIAIGALGLAGSAFCLISPLEDRYLVGLHGRFESLMGIAPPGVLNLVVPLILVIASFVVILIALTKDNSLFRWFAALATFVVTIVILASVFQPKYYSAFLKKIKYGGGISVEITYRIDEKQSAEAKGFLYILTGDYMVIKEKQGDDGSEQVTEVPRERIIRMVYGAE